MVLDMKYEKEFVNINGIEQFFLHFPADEVSKEVVLFLHGGPGTSEATSGHYILQYHLNAFHMVYYDQRGTGKTYMKNPDSVPDIEILMEDLHEIVEYLKVKYGKNKIVLLGHSWGTVLATLYIKEHPENVLCYIAAGQVVNKKMHEKARCDFLRSVYTDSNKKKKIAFLDELKELSNGTYDLQYFSKKHVRRLRMLQIRNKMLSGASFSMMKITKSSPVYEKSDMKVMMEARKVNYKLHDYVEGFDLQKELKEWPVKAMMISGDKDFQAPFTLVKGYVESMNKQNVEFVLLNNVGHFALIDQGEEFFSRVIPFVNSIS